MSSQTSVLLESIKKSGQRISNDGKIQVSKKAWVVRISALVGATLMVAYNVYLGLILNDVVVVYSTLLPIESILYVVVGWLLYRNPARGRVGNDQISVLVPIYNQKSVIEIVIDAIYRSTYKNIEVIAVNDGSTDGTKEILDDLAGKYPNLKVVHKERNEGKRKAVAAGFYASKSSYIVLIDSDSIIDEHAIEQIMKTFNADAKVGAIVGNAKVWNSEKNILTRCQDAWYDYSFNIRKATESAFGNVLCCSGCLAAYRREAIVHYIPYWVKAKLRDSEDRELTSYVISSPFANKLMESMAQYDDAEDRGLTAQALTDWKSVYVADAIIHTDVPEKLKVFLKQQKRWKKGTTRVNFFVSVFFWRKHPIMSLIFYIDFMMTFTTPLIIVAIFVYAPLMLQNFLIPASFIGGSFLSSLVHGADYRFRDSTTRNWIYKPLMNLITSFVISWLIIPALLSYRKNEWGTR